MSRTVRLTTCNNSYEAHILQGALLAEGISSALHNENMTNLFGGLISGFSGVDIFVYEDELDRAREVMKAAHELPQTSINEDTEAL